MRTLSVLVILLLVSASTAAFAQDSGMMLAQEPRKDFTGFGWTFLLLTAATLAYGVKAKADSDDDLERAEVNFTSYQNATTPTELTAFRTAANSALNDARANEERANLALFMTFVFGLTAWYSFNPEDLSDNSLAVTHNAIIFQHRF
jgi:hypothetical protein